jgi:hypothetical protein
MSNSPINFLGMLGAAGAVMGSRRSKKSRRKIKARVSKLENQMQAIQTKKNAGPTQVEQPIEIQPETPTGTVPQAFDGGMQEEEPQLLPNSPTIASPFTPGAQQAAGGMFGAPMPGSFDRNMGEEEEIY